MRIVVHSKKIQTDESVQDYLDRRVRFALSRFSPCVARVAVHLADINGKRGGVDKRCRIVVGLVPSGRVQVEDTDDDLYAVIARAADRIQRAVGHELERRRDGARTRSVTDGDD